jgi:hypothetical protein
LGAFIKEYRFGPEGGLIGNTIGLSQREYRWMDYIEILKNMLFKSLLAMKNIVISINTRIKRLKLSLPQ